eukprot:scaffold102189_cov64-Attheya_sp.AAC.2
MAIARNPHTYSGILFGSLLMEASKFRSLVFSFRWFALVSFGGKKLLRVFVFITFLRKLVLGAFFLDFGAVVAGIWAVLCRGCTNQYLHKFREIEAGAILPLYILDANEGCWDPGTSQAMVGCSDECNT